jgi:predicted deacylase
MIVSSQQFDLAVTGKQHLDVHLADGLSLPLTIIRHGQGPAVLVAGGTHGDEFEGQIAVTRLARAVAATDVRGTLILMPFHNVPACRAGTRLTPGDGSDLNRVYGRPHGSGPAHLIARFVETGLLPHIDWVIDLHSGGAAHEFVLSSNVQARYPSPECDVMLAPLLAFDAPYAIVFDEVPASPHMPHGGTLEEAARALGKKAISSELGGGGRATPQSLAVAEHGLRNLLSHIGVVPSDDATRPDQSRSRLLFLGRPEHHVTITTTGCFAPLIELGAEVRKGDLLGHIESRESAEAIHAPTAGVVIAVASRGLQQKGNAVVYLADDITPERI